jgi:acyl-coenzyme A thioesterase PaaI-like protein
VTDETSEEKSAEFAWRESAGFADRMTAIANADVTPQRAEMRRLADATRLIIDRLVASKAPVDDLAQAAEMLEAVARVLEGHPRGHSFEGFAETSTSGDPTAFFDHSPIMGHANPLAPPLNLRVEDGKIVGTAVYGNAYEGPPGALHGGFVACAFDEVLGMAQSLGGKPGMTGTLTVRYRKPTPLRSELRFVGELVRTEGRKIYTTGTLHAGDDLCAEADAVFISVDLAKIAARIAEQRDAREGAP